uniref:Uncharacterized protein n=1 Tax=Arundo donax TaxID=35708 RepID=A0A0A8YY04_ARUDO
MNSICLPKAHYPKTQHRSYRLIPLMLPYMVHDDI